MSKAFRRSINTAPVKSPWSIPRRVESVKEIVADCGMVLLKATMIGTERQVFTQELIELPVKSPF